MNQPNRRDPELRGNRPRHGPPWRARLYDIVFDSHDSVAKIFDVVLIVAILTSVMVVMLDSVEAITAQHGRILAVSEWIFTVLFTVEYGVRMISVRSKRRYAGSFFGVIDLVSIAPTYLSLFLPGTRFLAIIRVLRVLRIFRVLKLVQYVGEASELSRALIASRYRIIVFLISVLTLVAILGSFMYLIEGADAGFTSIPTSVYWAVVTLTTVGYGDITPLTPLGKLLASFIMLMGYGLIAVPTGLITAELTRAGSQSKRRSTDGTVRRECSGCGAWDHDADARNCKHCGDPVEGDQSP